MRRRGGSQPSGNNCLPDLDGQRSNSDIEWMGGKSDEAYGEFPGALLHGGRREFGSYVGEGVGVEESVVEAVAALARLRVHEIIPEQNVRRYTHGTGWTSPASPKLQPDEMRTISDVFEIRFEDIVQHNLSIITVVVSKIAASMAGQQIRTMFEAISEACDHSGNAVDGAGRPFAESFLEMLTGIEFGIGADGEVSMPSIMVPPDNAEHLLSELKRQPPEYHASVEALIESKKVAALSAEKMRLSRFRTAAS